MIEKLAERKNKINEALSGGSSVPFKSGEKMVSDNQLFKSLGKRLKVIKKS